MDVFRSSVTLGLATLIFAQSASAGEIFYKVRPQETISEIIMAQFPELRIYGPKGALRKIISLNPEIKDPDKIYPHQVIRLKYNNLNKDKSFDERKTSRTLSNNNEKAIQLKAPRSSGLPHFTSSHSDEFYFRPSVYSGPRYFSISQRGVLGTADVGVLSLKNLKFTADFILARWNAWFDFDTYQFNFLTTKKSLSSFKVGVSYDWIMGGFWVQQSPLFKNDAGEILLKRQNVILGGVGLKREVHLSSIKPTSLYFKLWVNLPISSSTDDPHVKADLVSGIGLKGQAGLRRQFYKGNDYSLHFSWENEMTYQRLSQSVEWDGSSGEVDSTYIHFFSILGFNVVF